MTVAEPVVAPDMAPDAALANLFFTEQGVAHPAVYYRHLRTVAPVHHSATGAIFLSRYDDCREVLRDNRLGKAARSGASALPSADQAAALYRREQEERARAQGRAVSMLFLNPPHHTRQRGLVARAFTPRRVEQLRAQIRVLSERIVADFVERGGGDVLEAIAFPLPVAVIGTLVGVPDADWASFRPLITAAAAGVEPGATLDELKAADVANAQIIPYFNELVATRRKDPRDDLLSDLIAVEEAGDQLSTGEVIAVAILLFAAGFETTTNLVGNGLGALLRNPSERDKLWNDPSLVDSAVEEMLRWDSPVQLDARSVLEPAEVAGHRVEVGTTVVTLLGAANRDPEHFSNPDSFDICRDEGPAMSFASGIHYCLGANLARAEGQEVFRALVERCSSIELDGELRQRNRMTLRGYEAVPTVVRAR